MPRQNEFINDAVEVGFTIQQAEFMNDFLAKFPHTYTPEDIDGLEDMVDEQVADFIGESEGDVTEDI